MKTTSAPISRCFLLLIVLSGATASPAFAANLGLGFNGTLEDGGSFSGHMLYSDEDSEQVSQANPSGVPDLGRFKGGLWQIDVVGGTTTVDADLFPFHRPNEPEHDPRALIETRLAPYLIGVYILGPEFGLGLALPRLSLMFEPRAGYDPDVQPTISDFLHFLPSLSVGNQTAFSGYQDSNGAFTRIATIQIRDATADFAPVPVPGGLGLMAGALWILAPALKRRSVRRAA